MAIQNWRKSQLSSYHTTRSHWVFLLFLYDEVQTLKLPLIHPELIHSRTVCSAKLLELRDGPFEVPFVRLVRIQSVRVVSLLIVDVHRNIGKH